MNKKLSDTIVAISTPIGQAGIGIVRLSGQKSLKIADKVFKSANHNGKKTLRPSDFKSHTINYGWIVEAQSAKRPSTTLGTPSGRKAQSAKIIDEVLLTVMKAPRTYTREDIVEINCHSGIVPLKKILDLVIKYGARLAEPGEFTRRAFLNGRIDLVQAESVLDLIRAKSEVYQRACINRLSGSFSSQMAKIHEPLFEIIAQLEAQIDFPQEDTQKPLGRAIKQVEKIIEELSSCLDATRQAKVARDGVSIAICGKPNVGKSSLLNALLNQERALVTPFAGTTRDSIEETLCLDGVALKLIDTAGLRDSKHPVEKEAVKRSQQAIESAELILLVFDGAKPAQGQDLQFIRKFKNRKNVLAVINKIDLAQRFSPRQLKEKFSAIVKVSALCRMNLDKLKQQILKNIWQGKSSSSSVSELIVNARQEKLLQEALNFLQNALFSLKAKLALEIALEDLKKAFSTLRLLCAKSTDVEEELLDSIFSQFCIGK